jgi:hypothetical protein
MITYDGVDYGVTPTGFVKMTDAVIKKMLQDAFVAIYGDPNLADDSVIGHRIGLMTTEIASLWDLAEAIYNTFDPASSAAAALDHLLTVAALTRLPAVKTEVECTCTTTGAKTIPTGSQVSNTAGDVFESIEDIVATGAGTFTGTFRALESGAV